VKGMEELLRCAAMGVTRKRVEGCTPVACDAVAVSGELCASTGRQ